MQTPARRRGRSEAGAERSDGRAAEAVDHVGARDAAALALVGQAVDDRLVRDLHALAPASSRKIARASSHTSWRPDHMMTKEQSTSVVE